MLKHSIILSLLLVLSTQAQAGFGFLSEEHFYSARNHAEQEILKRSVQNTIAGGKLAIDKEILRLEAQLVALKAAKLIHVDNEDYRYEVVVGSVFVIIGAGSWLTAKAAWLTYGAKIFSRLNPFTRVGMVAVVMGSGAYITTAAYQKTGLTLILSEAQLLDMISKVEDKIADLKKYR